MKAKKKKIDKVSPADLGVDVAPRYDVLEVSEPPARKVYMRAVHWLRTRRRRLRTRKRVFGLILAIIISTDSEIIFMNMKRVHATEREGAGARAEGCSGVLLYRARFHVCSEHGVGDVACTSRVVGDLGTQMPQESCFRAI